VTLRVTTQEGSPIMHIMTVGIDLAKNILQIHGMDQQGKTVVRKQFEKFESRGAFG